ncbi:MULTISPECIES: flagellar basal body P-ring formation chaperone FlgA [unclassified Ruegeria]|uniref:flagellar basal body P-ring formation chaperone FlgA n=1 Tax=unclassified Ruegeria TaxID=2625375 RepID=UPI001492F83D|nr:MULTISPECIES: flagellar basal body P-ring formation chaperone FlgA [unclassified Ruegeria]NOD49345.1 flagellar basal body P-ring formation protein FlgA [Ruegeria sp. HKCCD5849]NOD53356.1 flagellar basal body P-ring formation protein FlgA [Ruegeria sp. HKCCD5851]NOD69680.1 flagellar basal body P-ring formation protein FlgA [Ruegeria sp. HKCCD7303]
MQRLIAALTILIPCVAQSDIVVSTRTIRAKEIIVAADLEMKPTEVAGAAKDPEALIGQEARVALYPGRPIRDTDVGPPAVVDRNDRVILVFNSQPLSITTEGRALGRGAIGERIRVMNLSSRTTVTGRIRPDGQIEVQ